MRWIWEWFCASLSKQWFLWTLFIVNLLGTIYGFYWYKNQLAATEPAFFRIFVPDSPTGSALFTLVLFTYIIGKQVPLLEALAAITNFKYGIWAVAVIVAGWSLGNEVRGTDCMLVLSHAGMAVESLLYTRMYKLSWLPVGVAALWTLNNDFLDYVMDIHPWLPDVLVPYSGYVGLFTVLLSLLSISLIWYLNARIRQIKV